METAKIQMSMCIAAVESGIFCLLTNNTISIYPFPAEPLYTVPLQTV